MAMRMSVAGGRAEVDRRVFEKYLITVLDGVGHGFAGFRSRICGVEVTNVQVRAYVTDLWGRRLRILDAEGVACGGADLEVRWQFLC